MGGKKLLKQATALLLAAAVILTQQSITGADLSKVYAADGSWAATSYVVNGDFEDGVNGWSIANTNTTVTTESISNEWASDTSNHFLNLWTETALDGTDSTISQTISDLPAGKYYLSIQNAGDSGDSIFKVSINDIITDVPLTARTGWDTWTATSTAEFEVTEVSNVTITLTADAINNGAYEKLDNIILYEWKDAPAYSFEELTALLATVPNDYASMGFTASSTAALSSAVSAASACTESSEANAIEAAYTSLSAALEGLTLDGTVFVQKISSYDEDSIRGVDVSSYLSLMDSFDAINASITDPSQKAGFRDWNGNLLDKQGFFNLLASSGVNYVRLRVWNDPYNAEGKGYGGGDNDMAKAVEMGQYTTNAGMKVLIDFHFSDFWADPAKQKAPKAWSSYTTAEKSAAVSEYVTTSLTDLKNANVNVGMVQIGNETTGSFCGEQIWADMNLLFDAGCDAIHAFNEANSTSILAALHFTNPEKSGSYASIASKLADYDGNADGTKEGVSYDVFASSYYPFWHGTLHNLTSVLSNIATTYDKYVMVAETSWATTLEDGDGHSNTVRSGNNDSGAAYAFTVQGQANEVRSVAAAVNDIDITLANGKSAALGIFYWEPAWIPVQYAYDENGQLDSTLLASNKSLWEEYGSGWASSYASGYDPEDAGLWYGGSAIDNQAMFDFNGRPLASLNVFKYFKYGSSAALTVDSYTCDAVSVEVGNTFTGSSLPQTATITYNDSSTANLAVTWNPDDISTVISAAQTNSGIGTYTVRGAVVPTEGTTYDVKCIVSVIPRNILDDYSFENSSPSWTITGTGAAFSSQDDSKTGTNCIHFYDSSAFSFQVSQTVTIEDAGLYSASLSIQGGSGTGSNDGESIYLEAVTSSGTTYKSDLVTLTGWKSWAVPKIDGIAAASGDTITITMYVTANAESWGTMDDAYLYLDQPADNNPVSLENAAIVLSQSSCTYNGAPQEPAVTSVTVNGTALTKDKDYTVAYSKNTNAGTAAVTITGMGNYTGSATKSFTINSLDMAANSKNFPVSMSSSLTYTGKEITPITGITYNSKPLTINKDYNISYSGNIDAGKATAVITGKGNYSGSITKTFTIAPASIGNAAIMLTTSSYTYNGKDKKPDVTVLLNGKAMDDANYTVTYSNNRKAGTAAATVTGKGNYTGSLKKTFKIAKAKKTISVKTSSCKKTYGSKAFYLNAAATGKEALTYSSSSKSIVTVDRKGKVTIKGCGKATITIASKASANYNGAASKKITITVLPKAGKLSSVTSKKASQMTVKWSGDPKAKGYVISYSTNKNFKKAKTVTVSSSKTTSKTIPKLSKGKKYYVKVRSYTIINGKKVYGNYSTSKYAVIKKK